MREHLLADLPITERRLELSGLSTAVLEGGDDPPVILSNRSRTSRDDRFRRKAITPLLRWRVTAWDGSWGIPGGRGVRVGVDVGSFARACEEVHPLGCQCHDAGVGSKRERQADRALVAAYDEARLGELVDRVAAAFDRFRVGELDAFAVDDVIHQYHRAARGLWKFCWLGGSGAGVELTARALRDLADQGERTDWWQLGAPRERGAERP